MGSGCGGSSFSSLMRELAWEEIVHNMLWDADFGNGILEDGEEEGDEAQEHQLLLHFLQGLVQRLLVLALQVHAGVVEEPLRRQRYGHDDRADQGHNPCGRVL